MNDTRHIVFNAEHAERAKMRKFIYLCGGMFMILLSAGFSSAQNPLGELFNQAVESFDKAVISEKPADFIEVFSEGVDNVGKTILKATDTKLPLDVEKEIGNKFYENVCMENEGKIYEASKKDEKLYAAWSKLKPKRADLKFRLFVIEDEIINAFAHCGGYIYVHTALIKSMNESEIALVLAHEISHVDLEHTSVGIVRQSVLNNIPLGSIAENAARFLSPSYSHEQEFEADAAGLEIALAAGYKKADMLSLFDNLPKDGGLREKPHKVDFVNTGLDTIHQADRVMYQIQYHYSTHPNSEDRKKRLNKILPQTDHFSAIPLCLFVSFVILVVLILTIRITKVGHKEKQPN